MVTKSLTAAHAKAAFLDDFIAGTCKTNGHETKSAWLPDLASISVQFLHECLDETNPILGAKRLKAMHLHAWSHCVNSGVNNIDQDPAGHMHTHCSANQKAIFCHAYASEFLK